MNNRVHTADRTRPNTSYHGDTVPIVTVDDWSERDGPTALLGPLVAVESTAGNSYTLRQIVDALEAAGILTTTPANNGGSEGGTE